MPYALSVIRNNPEVHTVLFVLHTQNTKKSQVNLVNIEDEVLVLLVLASLENFHVETVRIFWIVIISSPDGTVITSVLTDSETRHCRSHSVELVYCAGASSLAGINSGLDVNFEVHIFRVLFV